MHTYVALPSRKNTHDKVHSSVALTIFLEVGFKSNLSCCWLDSKVAYFFIFIFVVATWRLLPVDDTYLEIKRCTIARYVPLQVYKYAIAAYIFNDKWPIFIFQFVRPWVFK